MAQLHVDLGDNSYPIHINADFTTSWATFAQTLSNRTVVIISNTTVAPLYLDSVVTQLPSSTKHFIFTIADGEAYKTLDTYESALRFLLENTISRDAIIIALGGGVVGDLTGFVAACYQRGVDFVQIPTTLLSQVDSSVGGKTAVNHELGKNMIGAFYQPKAVFIGTDSLQTLPPREFAAGMAEVIKYGIIYDKPLFDYIDTHKSDIKALSPTHLEHIITRCCEIKADIVHQDEKESGIRALLNLGHTFGHAIEAEMGYGKWLHGEAVSAGIVIACQLAVMRNDLSNDELTAVTSLLSFFDLPIEGPKTMTCNDYLRHMGRDKKVKAGKIRFIVPTSLGSADIFSDVTDEELALLLG